jgi:hypothetical protein
MSVIQKNKPTTKEYLQKYANKVWENRRPIMATFCMSYGIYERAKKKNYNTALDNSVSDIAATALDKVKTGFYYDNNQFQLNTLCTDIIGTAIASAYPAVTLAICGVSKVIDAGMGIQKTIDLEKAKKTLTNHAVKPANNILQCNGVELAKHTHNNMDTTKKPLTIFLNHGTGGNFKEGNTSEGAPQLRHLINKISKNKTQNRPINLVSVRQNAQQPVIMDKLIAHFDKEDSDYAVLGYSAGCVSAIEQANSLNEKGKNVEKIILKAPVYNAIPMPSAISWVLKPFENVIFSSGLITKTPFGSKEAWQGTLNNQMKIPEHLQSKTTIIQHEKDLAVTSADFNQFERLKTHFPNAKIIQEKTSLAMGNTAYDKKTAGHVGIMSNSQSLDYTIKELLGSKE